MKNRLRQQALFHRLKKREYTKGEILYAVDKLADDPELSEKLRYGGDLSGADFRRVIEPLRKMRSRLRGSKRLTEEEVWRAYRAGAGASQIMTDIPEPIGEHTDGWIENLGETLKPKLRLKCKFLFLHEKLKAMQQRGADIPSRYFDLYDELEDRLTDAGISPSSLRGPS